MMHGSTESLLIITKKKATKEKKKKMELICFFHQKNCLGLDYKFTNKVNL